MKVFIAGATGAIGNCLVPQLIAAGYEVVGTTRHADKAQLLKSIGAEGIVLDALDRAAVMRAVEQTRPDVIVNELTSIPPKVDFRHFDKQFAMTNRLRSEGTEHLLEAAVRMGFAVSSRRALPDGLISAKAGL
jgi:nucleoside-diphosphate-sugar epimerase